MSQLDLRVLLQELSARVMEHGIQPATVHPGALNAFASILYHGLQLPDAGQRATAMAYALNTLRNGIGAAPAPNTAAGQQSGGAATRTYESASKPKTSEGQSAHRPIDDTVWSRSSSVGPVGGDDLVPLEIPCPACGGDVVARSFGRPLQYVCRNCGKTGIVR